MSRSPSRSRGGLLRAGARTAAALVSAVLLSGCEAALVTNVTVAPTSSAIVTSATFDATAADAFSDEMVGQLSDVFVARIGVAPTVVRGRDGTLTVSVAVPYDQLVAVSDLTGVASARIEIDSDASQALLHVDLVDPVALRAAIVNAAATQLDGDALVAAMTTQTRVGVAATFPGPVLSVVTPPGTEFASPAVDGATVTFTQPLSLYVPGAFAVLGELSTPSTFRRLYLPGAALTGVAAIVVMVRRRWR
jgi:hypothetical protein